MNQFRVSRRSWMKRTSMVASSIALPLWTRRIMAQSQSTLNALPRTALIIGNTKYSEVPLKNPGNDAKAIAAELQKTGFKVILQLDAVRAQMADAIQAFCNDLAKTKGVGLFYYAGHGAQLAWRNYLIPADAEIDQIDDLRTKTVELNSVLQGLIKARNPMNVIILDACRDNPFGGKVLTEQKGLSQFDAPPGSLLAYATSPGKTAADGDGTNGLYTEHLVRELRVPEAKIEDVFKRVRLAVRRVSEGRQIPWESTSLEEDFYFLPPQSIRKLSEAELRKQFNQELAIWERIKDTREPDPLEDYLRTYPSGKFSELAQFRLDRLLAERERKQIEAENLARQAEQERLARLADEEKKKQTRLVQEKRVAEENRITEERKLAEETRLAVDRKIATLGEDKRRAEEAWLVEERRAAEARRLEQERKLAEERKVAEDNRLTEEKRLAEETRLARVEEERRKKSQTSLVPTPIASIGPNPFSKGTGKMDPNYQMGDSYTYREIDILTKLEQRQYTERVTDVKESEVIYNDGQIIMDLLGNPIKNDIGQYTGSQFFVPEYSVGKKWTTRFRVVSLKYGPYEQEIDFKVLTKETISVPAGIFDAYKVEGKGFSTTGSYHHRIYWIAPEQVRRPLVFVSQIRTVGGNWFRTDRRELVTYRQAA